MLSFSDYPYGGTMDHRLLEIIACPVCN
ncbi:tetraacyldisaccharide 4-kinase, partial [Escherichia coli]